MTMSCESCRDQLPDLVFDELASELRGAMVEHVTHCPDCALEHARWALDVAAIAPAWEAEPPQAVGAALRRQVEAAFVPAWARWWGRAVALVTRPVPAYGVIAAVVIPFVLWSVSPRRADELAPAPPEVHAPASAPRVPAASSELPPPRVVGYDARSIVPAPVF
jgi:anti-sigma factor RsiW